MKYEPLPVSGRRHKSSLDALQLICSMIEMKGRVEREFSKRGRILNVPERVHRLAVNVAVIMQRFEQRNFQHHEIEEGYIKEFGEWLIQTYAEITGTQAGTWEHEGVPFNPAVHLRKPKSRLIT